MIDADQVPDVSDDELLARYVLQSKLLRNDRTVRPDLFMPHPYQELSLTRYLNATIEEVLAIGEDIAKKLNRTLYGRADIQAVDCKVDSLKVVKKPMLNNPNHADIEGFPPEKQDQKAIALRLAAAAKFISHSSS
jgi:hypothetical protein